MQHHKCCYCENYLPDRGSGKQVEHFRPRSKYPDLINEWENLLLACGTCNGEKNDEFPLSETGEPLLLDPSNKTVEPEDHIDFVVVPEQGSIGPKGLAIPKNNSEQGKATIETIGLASSYHVKQRYTAIRYLEVCYLQLKTWSVSGGAGASSTEDATVWKAKLAQTVEAGEAHASVARAYARHTGWEEL